MREVYKNLYIGDDSDYEKIKDKSSWFVVRACKDGPGGHRDLLGYTTMGAPKGPQYLSVEKPRLLAANLVDSDNADYVPNPLVDKILSYISDNLRLGHKVLIACNRGESRGPSLGLLWLVENGHLPRSGAIRRFRQIYPDYAPARGIQIYTRQRIAARR